MYFTWPGISTTCPKFVLGYQLSHVAGVRGTANDKHLASWRKPVTKQGHTFFDFSAREKVEHIGGKNGAQGRHAKIQLIGKPAQDDLQPKLRALRASVQYPSEMKLLDVIGDYVRPCLECW